jgi:ABC-2 type transport system ATP-binding protein
MGLVAYRGRIKVNGLDVSRKGKEVRKMITYVPQQFSLYDNLSSMGNIRFFAGIKGISEKSIRNRLRIGDLEDYEDKRAGELSEGLKQRLMLSIAKISESPILLFDEPTSNLDFNSVIDFKELIKSQVQKDTTILLSTHLLSDVNEIADKVIVINKGKLLFTGKVNELLEKMDLTLRILITLNKEPDQSSAEVLKDILTKAGAKEVITENEFITVSSGSMNKISVLKAVEDSGFSIKDFRIFDSNLEEAFLKITEDKNN